MVDVICTDLAKIEVQWRFTRDLQFDLALSLGTNASTVSSCGSNPTMIKAPPLFPVNRGSGQSRLDTAPDTPGTLRNELVKKPNASAPLAESGSGIPVITRTRRWAYGDWKRCASSKSTFSDSPPLM